MYTGEGDGAAGDGAGENTGDWMPQSWATIAKGMNIPATISITPTNFRPEAISLKPSYIVRNGDTYGNGHSDSEAWEEGEKDNACGAVNQFVTVKQEGNKIIFIVDIVSYLKSQVSIPIKSMDVATQDNKIVITAEIDSEELIKMAQVV